MSEEAKKTGTGKKTTEACCAPGAMQEFFQKMAAFCPGMGDTPDWKAMMKDMKETFCGEGSEEARPGGGN